eukprot:jgi/Tetstr1/466518/TSEL_011025.t1
MASHRSARQAGYPPGGPPAEQSMRQIVEKKMLEARVVAPTQNISHKLADVHDFPAVKAFLENVDKEISDRNKLWVPETEAWLGRQFKTDSIAAHTHQLVLNSHELQVHIVMGCEVLTHFVNYQDWKQAFFKAAFPNDIQTTVGDYARNICIKPSDPKMATCCVDLQRKLQAAFALLHEPFVVPEYLQVQRILQAIPKHERAEVQKMANHNNEVVSTHEVLFRHLSAIDEEHRVAVEIAQRRQANIKKHKRGYEEYSGAAAVAAASSSRAGATTGASGGSCSVEELLHVAKRAAEAGAEVVTASVDNPKAMARFAASWAAKRPQLRNQLD